MAQEREELTPLGLASRGYRGVIHEITPLISSSLSPEEIERRLLELGFSEGAEVAVLHEGPISRDPIAVRVGGVVVALRRQEAMAILTREGPYHA
ncbi:iron transporter FeoA [Brucella endophytica]|uniref:Iron transporter FeoA n=1 Tax=Brucella endophytica TaxID=1963359 RepID=A0A916SEY0_9HYPH|nr:FeoA domain-containing protein [Brucella endophytica]GGA97195.1 iron transporter FeoA [Brucella endophytica]